MSIFQVPVSEFGSVSLCDYQAIVSSIGVSVNVCVIVKSLGEFLVIV